MCYAERFIHDVQKQGLVKEDDRVTTAPQETKDRFPLSRSLKLVRHGKEKTHYRPHPLKPDFHPLRVKKMA